MSPTDSLEELQSKMGEYISCPKGYRSAYDVKLGWLINPDAQEVEIYRFGQDKQVISNPSSLSGEELLLGLTVDLADIF